MEMKTLNSGGVGSENVKNKKQKTQFNNSMQELWQSSSLTLDTNATPGSPSTHKYKDTGAGVGGSHREVYMESSEMIGASGNISGSHREMAIDCPPSFVGTRKEPPRFPRPLSTIQTSATNSPKTSFSTPSKDVKSRSSVEKQQQSEQAERIRRYQEDIIRKRELEEKIKRENEFLRTSLRDSKKLLDLENKRKSLGVNAGPSGIVNPNYLVEEDDDGDLMRVRTVALHQSVPHGDRTTAVGVDSAPLILQDVLDAVDKTQKYLSHPDDQKEINIVAQFVVNEQFQKLLTIYNKIVEVWLDGCEPVHTPAGATVTELSHSVKDEMHVKLAYAEAQELYSLLDTPHIRNLLLAYDKTSKLKSLPVSKSSADEDEREYLYERASQYGEDSIKIVRLQKTADPLGATVRNEGDSVVIGRIVRGGTAEKSGLLHEGDEILEINGVDIRGKSINEVCDLMSSLSGVLTFLINPGLERGQLIHDDQIMHVRAHFNYDPEEDHYIPCRELGISFLKGDILHVINQEDEHWWQVRREGEEDQALAGLVPSRAFQQKREALKLMMVGDAKENDSNQSRCHCSRKRRKKKPKLYNANGDEVDGEQILTYEEVTQYYPQPNRKRPIVLIGPPNVGCQELRQRLMESDLDRFAAAIPHTSRPPTSTEVNGRDYHFVSASVFEADIADNKFVEYGEYEKHFFGTSMEAIRQVVNSGKICVLNFHPQALPKMKMSDLKPYFVFIAPPNIEKLKQMRQKQGVKLTDDELKTIIEKAREMEETYGHYFDLIIVNQDLDRAYDELLAEINRLEVEPQWVPSLWVT